jgi:hypothetical protein
MVERDHPAAVHLAHEAGVDAVLRVLGTVEPIAADQLRRVGGEQLDANVPEVEVTAPFGRAAIVPNVVVERALPVLLEAALRDE